MKILNFGSCNIDFVYSLDHIVEAGETETTHLLETFPGGKGLNQSIAVAKAGAHVYHAGCLGTDSEMLSDIMTSSGVDLTYMSRTEAKNGHAIIQVSKDGENSIFLYPGSNYMITKEYVDSVIENFDEGDIILLQNEINDIDYIVKEAYKKKMCIILNPSPYNEKLEKINFNELSYILVNQVEAKAISGCGELDESIKFIRSKYPKLKVVLTLGSKGCVFIDNKCELFQSAFKVDAVDTTAAGDTFTGYFIAELSKGTEYQKILRIASAASAIAVSRKGAAPSIPDSDEVLASLAEMKENISNDRFGALRRQLDEYVENNIKTANLEELASLFGYSMVYTGNLVKKITGESFSKLVRDRRCSIAANLLTNTELPIENIINEVGYENKSFFRKVFKEKYGKNPLEFRKRSVK